MKAGEIRIPHFAHKNNSDCTSPFSEPESYFHLEGKKHLNHFFNSKGLTSNLEHYIPAIRQRPDLLVKYEGKSYAIEYQCSTLSRKSLKNRTQGYLNAGITSLWIIGGHPFQKKKQNIFELTDFHWSFAMPRVGFGLTLLSYHPYNRMLYLLSNITPLSPRKVFANLHTQSLKEVSLPLQFPHINQAWIKKHWLLEKKKWIEKKVRFSNIVNDTFLKNVYTSGNNPFLLPNICGLPVLAMEHIQDHPLEWQFYIYEDCLKDLNIGQRISLKYVKHKLGGRMRQGNLTRREFPLRVLL